MLAVSAGCATFSNDWRAYQPMKPDDKIGFLSEAINGSDQDDCWQATKLLRKSYFNLGPNVGRLVPDLNRALKQYKRRNPKLADDIKRALEVLDLAGIAAPAEYLSSVSVASNPPIRPSLTVSTLPPTNTPVASVPPAAGDGVLTLAVLDLQAGGGVSASDAAVASDWLRVYLVNERRIRVIDRGNMDRLLAEQAFQQTGCTKQDCAVKLGKLLNASHVVAGNFSKFMTSYVINVFIVKVESGQIILAEEAKGREADEISANIRLMATRIADKYQAGW
jgi:hypothetical protein